jgi:hypothetical protein
MSDVVEKVIDILLNLTVCAFFVICALFLVVIVMRGIFQVGKKED